jgi:aryl carrier-like protein
MLPAAFVMLDALPVTANGKVDRAALPAPEGGRQVGTTFVAPQTELETLIATAWREGLRVDQVGLDDNFFDLGGNSMLLMRVHSKLKHAIGNELQLMDLFRFPTIRALAQHFSQTDVGDEAARFDSVRERARRRREAGRRAAPTSTH